MADAPQAAPPSITELPNELTDGIDLASPLGIVRLLRQSDAQMFIGWREYPSLYDTEILRKLGLLTAWAAEVLSCEAPRRIVMSGAGTSGRLAYFVARTFNGLLQAAGQEPVFHYLIAGGNAALIAAQEGAEDNPHKGAAELEAAFEGAERGLYIGITCGVSAPYVAGQVDWLMERERFYTVLMGFNPPERARRVKVEGWDKTVGDVVDELLRRPARMMLLNPVYGPETITGSTRMKGGSMTKMLLEMVFRYALDIINLIPEEFDRKIRGITDEMDFGDEEEEDEGGPRGKLFSANGGGWDDEEEEEEEDGGEVESWQSAGEEGEIQPVTFGLADEEDDELFPVNIIEKYEDQVRAVYMERHDLARLIEAGGEALRNQGHIYYLGYGPLGVLALVDASECPPTFGARFEHVRGFVEGGWNTILGPGGEPPSREAHYRVDLGDYERDILPSLTPADLVVGVGLNGFTAGIERLMLRSLQSGARTAAILIRCPGLKPPERAPQADPFLEPQQLADYNGVKTDRRILTDHGWVRVIPEWTNLCVSPVATGNMLGVYKQAEAELAAKLCFNALTTGAHVLAGKVYGNRMIDLRISNNKLYYRTLGIIRALTGADEITARRAMHRSIFAQDTLTAEQEQAPPSVCIPIATWKDRIVPRAILLATGLFDVESATNELKKEPVVRRVIERLKAGGA